MHWNPILGSGLLLCGSLLLCAASSDDQTSKTPPSTAAQSAQEKEKDKKKELASWWERNSREYSNDITQWLFHASGSLSYMNAAGNSSGSTFDTTANAELRKRHVTSRSYVQLTRKNMVYGFGGGSVNYVERTLREQLDYDFVWYLKLVGGIEDYRNTLMFMDDRRSVYGGLGTTLFRSKNASATFTLGAGHSQFDFDRTQMMRVNPGGVATLDTSPSSAGGLALQTLRWRVSPRLSLNQDSSYMKYIDSYLGQRWTINVSANVPLAKHVSFTVVYRVKEENNTIIKALRVEPQDRTFVLGIRLST